MGRSRSRKAGLLALALSASVSVLAGCAHTQEALAAHDPLEPFNRVMYNFNDSLDRHLIGPVSNAYVEVTPQFVRQRVTSFFNNVSYPWVVINDLLQLKFRRGMSDTGRFLVNTTLGIGGLLDIATGFGLPQHDEDLGQTFGYWGAGEGVYLVLPVLGPNSLRDIADIPARTFVSPLQALDSTAQWSLMGLNGINTRANYSSAIRIREQSALDPYVFTRSAYRQRREYLIDDGNVPLDNLGPGASPLK